MIFSTSIVWGSIFSSFSVKSVVVSVLSSVSITVFPDAISSTSSVERKREGTNFKALVSKRLLTNKSRAVGEGPLNSTQQIPTTAINSASSVVPRTAKKRPINRPKAAPFELRCMIYITRSLEILYNDYNTIYIDALSIVSCFT